MQYTFIVLGMQYAQCVFILYSNYKNIVRVCVKGQQDNPLTIRMLQCQLSCNNLYTSHWKERNYLSRMNQDHFAQFSTWNWNPWCTGWKKWFPKNENLLETTRNHNNSTGSFPIVSISGKPLCGFPLGFHTCKQSTRGFHLDSLHWKLLGNLTSGFHKFPHLGKQSTRGYNHISMYWKLWGNLTGGFHHFHTSKQSNVSPSMGN